MGSGLALWRTMSLLCSCPSEVVHTSSRPQCRFLHALHCNTLTPSEPLHRVPNDDEVRNSENAPSENGPLSPVRVQKWTGHFSIRLHSETAHVIYALCRSISQATSFRSSQTLFAGPRAGYPRCLFSETGIHTPVHARPLHSRGLCTPLNVSRARRSDRLVDS